jgi:aminoglycoside phosphotransferase
MAGINNVTLEDVGFVAASYFHANSLLEGKVERLEWSHTKGHACPQILYYGGSDSDKPSC